MQKITTYLWFDNQAEEAAALYTSLFEDSKIVEVHRQGEGGPAMMVAFELAGQRYLALNGGPGHDFSDAISLFVDCEDQEEVDRLWGALTADGGKEGPCGWLTDKYGVSWQIIPKALPRLMSDPDPARAQRAMQAMHTMTKIDVKALEDAARG
ncbi:VOC family protein [Nonomuraea sp. NPDC050536]|uniref:VOC family protein n=1 Tax=Nonomuraea sp. NPDC050536 TaxID=3364366 RepID=UPI0037C83D14